MVVGIVGLGLIGGSMAKAITKCGSAKVLGIDIDSETMDMAIMSGAISEVLDYDRLEGIDLILLALVPKAIYAWIDEYGSRIPKDIMLMDLCGIKQDIHEKIVPIAKKYGFKYIGGHPMAGKEDGGFRYSSAELFEGGYMIIVPEEDTDIVILERLKEFFLRIGFRGLTYTTYEEHDRMIAYTSQLAHITSNAFIKSPTSREQLGYSAGSFKDLTRVAKLDSDMWTALFMANRNNLISEVKTLIDNLEPYLEALRDEDYIRLKDLLEEGRVIKCEVDAQ